MEGERLDSHFHGNDRRGGEVHPHPSLLPSRERGKGNIDSRVRGNDRRKSGMTERRVGMT